VLCIDGFGELGELICSDSYAVCTVITRKIGFM